MKSKLKYAVLFLLLSNTLLANTPGKFGLGIILGEPTGLSLNCI